MNASLRWQCSTRGRRPIEVSALGCLALLVLSGVSGCGGPSVPNRHVTSLRPPGCAECHVDIACQWQNSTHASAWTNPIFQEKTDGAAQASCLPCHAPEPLLEQPPLESPRLRDRYREDGIDCHACHAYCGGYAGRYHSFGPHIMADDPTDLPCSEFCGRCHKTEMEEYEEQYVPAVAPQTPPECADCHMPRYEARLTQGHLLSYIHPRRPVHDHAFPLWTPVITAGAVEIAEFRVSRPGATAVAVQMALLNRGAGHRIPTGKFGHGEVRVLVEVRAAEQRVVAQAERSLRARTESALAPGAPAVLSFEIDLPPDAPSHDVRVVVERVNADRSFRYVLAERERLLNESDAASE